MTCLSRFAVQSAACIRIHWQIGVESDDRAVFWRLAWHALKTSHVDVIYNVGFVCHHVIQFTREALRDEHNMSLYAAQDVKRKEAWAGLGGAGAVSRQ